MTATALILAFALLAADTPPTDSPPAADSPTVTADVPQPAPPAPAPTAAPVGEPLPLGAPTGEYQLTAWCYGALGEYLEVYERVKPDVAAIDKAWGSSVPNEKEPYAADMAAARKELKVLAEAVQAAEKASPKPIAAEGAQAIKQGQSIWHPAETKSGRELARAWMSWGLPDRCDTTARALSAKSALFGKALKYNDSSAPDSTPPAPASAPPSPSGA